MTDDSDRSGCWPVTVVCIEPWPITENEFENNAILGKGRLCTKLFDSSSVGNEDESRSRDTSLLLSSSHCIIL